jgi:beta-glucosidase
MCSYNAIDGVPACANKLLANVIRGEFGFHGYITSDCGAIDDFYSPTGHHYSPDAAHAAAAAVLAGTDTNCGDTYKALPQAVKEGLISEQAIDTAVKRLFTARFRLGMFDPQSEVPYAQIPYSEVDSAAHRELSLKAAREAMVLLKNEHQTLPLKNVRTIAVVGPNAVSLAAIEGNYNAIPSNPVFPLDGIQAEFPSAKVIYQQGSPYDAQLPLPVPRTAFHHDGKPGLKAEYFASSLLSGDPAETRTDRQIDFDWDAASPVHGLKQDDFGVRWTGTIEVPKPGDYSFQIRMSDCYPCSDVEKYTVWVDGKQVGQFSTGGQDYRSTRLPMFHVTFADTKPHAFKMEYSHHSRLFGAGVALVWIAPVDAERQAAVDAASKADAVIAVMGLSPNLEGEEMPIHVPGFNGGDRTAINLPQAQEDLLKALGQTGKPLIVVLMNGSALAVDWAQQHAQAILEAWYPGETGGQAIGETLAGKNNPGGKLPVTFYASLDELPPFTDYSMKNRTYRYFHGQPLYGFGYGLSYTSFAYQNVHLSTGTVQAGEPLTVEADVRNAGAIAGDDVAELYLIPPQNGVNPLRELEGFQRVHLAAGETKHLTFHLDPRQLSLVNEAGDGSVAAGDYSVFVGGSQPDNAAGQTAKFTIDGSKALGH